MDTREWRITLHAFDQFILPERFGDAIAYGVSKALEEILEGPHHLLRYTRDTVITLVLWQGRWVRVYLDPVGKTLVTVYPANRGDVDKAKQNLVLTDEWVIEFLNWRASVVKESDEMPRSGISRAMKTRSDAFAAPLGEVLRAHNLRVPEEQVKRGKTIRLTTDVMDVEVIVRRLDPSVDETDLAQRLADALLAG